MNHILIFLIIVTPLLTGCGAAPSEPAAVVENTDEPNPTAVENTTEPAATAVPPAGDSEPATAAESPTATPEPDPTATPSPEPEAAPATPTPPPTAPAEMAVAVEGDPDLDYAQVVYVKATQNSDGTWRFDTTVRHNDQGWDDYADAWQVVDPQTGQVLGERILLHPHDNEQPFTRSQSGVAIPPDVAQVIVRAKDNVEGFGGEVVLVDLTVEQGEKFEVRRLGD